MHALQQPQEADPIALCYNIISLVYVRFDPQRVVETRSYAALVLP